MKKFFLFLILISGLIPFIIRAENDDESMSESEVMPAPVEEVSPASDATPTDTSSEAVPESMEEATFDDVSYE
jgi:hypothetical protein